MAGEEAAATSELHSSFCVRQVSVYYNRMGRWGNQEFGWHGLGGGGGLVGLCLKEKPGTCCLPNWKMEKSARVAVLRSTFPDKIVSIELRCHLAIDAKILHI